MSIEPGRLLAHYRVVGIIGAGGMGEVYRASDTVLGRDVAIKTLPQDVASDPARVARFRREAHLLASLNHPHIAAIHGFEQADHVSFLVLEFVEGEDLADRLVREPLSIREAVKIARQVADALETAHESGIVHRDLKPANIKVRPDGTVKVLDFGLAKAWSGEGVGAAAPLLDSPTVTYDGTAAGVILGTAAYMAPEQARGRVVDRRADVWAFGAVLFEMLTRRPAFGGETVTDILASVVHRDPDWQLLPQDTPASVRTLLRRCLAKDPGERLPHIGAARMELADVLSGGSTRDGELPIVPRAHAARSRARAWLLGVSVMTAAAALTAFLYSGSRRDVPPLMRLAIELPTDLRLTPEPPQISPDGRYVAVVGRQSGEKSRIWIRPLDAAAFRPLAGTEEAEDVFWAADSRALGFLAAGTRTLKRVSVTGGSPQTLCTLGQTEFTVGASWNSAGLILFSKASATEAAIFSLSSPGRTPTAVTPRAASSTEVHFYPQWLPDHRRFLFVVRGDPRTSGLYMSSIDDPSLRERMRPETDPAVVRNGQLLFVRSGTLFAQPVDARMRLAGEPAPIAENAGAFSVSDAGTVVYLPARSPDMQLTWVARNGRTMAPFGDPKAYRQISLSSHGQVAAEIEGSPGGPHLGAGRARCRVESGRFEFGSSVVTRWHGDRLRGRVEERSSPQRLSPGAWLEAGEADALRPGSRAVSKVLVRCGRCPSVPRGDR